jgi:hypothetical protein
MAMHYHHHRPEDEGLPLLTITHATFDVTDAPFDRSHQKR